MLLLRLIGLHSRRRAPASQDASPLPTQHKRMLLLQEQLLSLLMQLQLMLLLTLLLLKSCVL